VKRVASPVLFSALLAAAPQSSRAQAAPPGDPPPGLPATIGRTPAPSTHSSEELAEVKALEQDFENYRHAATLHEDRIRAVLYREYLQRKAQLDTKYGDRIRRSEQEHRRRQLDAIAMFEEFLRKYPSHPQFSPDAMFRLADLYVDDADFRYEKAQELAMQGIKDGTAQAPGPAPADGDEVPYEGPDYSKALGLWRSIVGTFPGYRQRDSTLYLLGYYLGQLGREGESKQAYLGLVCSNKYQPLAQPPPPLTREQIRQRMAIKEKFTGYDNCETTSDFAELIQEAWVRGIGDAHFNSPGELREAIASYQKVALNKESKYYDEALYKLAWSYYRNDDFIDGIKAFDQSVAYSDKLEQTGKPPLDLRGEAITYIAISFTDPWTAEEQADPVRSLERANAFYQGRYKERHVRDVYDQLGDTFRIIEAYEQSIESWRLILKHYPLHPKNPLVHQKIVAALEAMGNKDAADNEAALLASAYNEGTDWYRANETDREAMEAQGRIGRRMLRATAENTHRAAQIARKDWEANQTSDNRQRYIDLYQRAAALYTTYLETYPDSPEVYEFTYRIADTKFFSEQYQGSIPYYRWVRNHRELSDKYYLKAALSIVQAHQAEVDKQLAAGTLVEPPVPTAEALKRQGEVRPMAIPQAYRELQDAYDEYQRLVEDPKTAPTMALAAALVSYRHQHLDDAIARFQVVLKRFCGSAEATRAKDGLLVIYEARGQDDKFKQTNDAFITANCGDEAAISLARAQHRSKEFQQSESLFNRKEYDKAAVAFYRFYKTSPDEDPNLPIALYNSAVAYERSGRPKTAVFLFKEFTQNPSPAFRDSPYYVEALYLTAVAYQKAFDYTSAVDTYLEVVAVASQPGRTDPPGQRSLQQIRLDALFNAALLRELDRVYWDPANQPGTGAVSLYRRYHDAESDRRKKDRALWAIARVYESARDHRNLLATYEEWRKAYGRDPGNEQDYVFTYYNTAKIWEKKGVTKAADRARKETMNAWVTVGRPQGTPTAEMAAESEFYDAEAFYKSRVESFAFNWPKQATNKVKVEAALNEFDRLNDTGQKKFQDIGKYRSPIWGAAALVRIGDIQFFSAQKLINAQAPKEILKLDERYPDRGILDAWQSRIEEIVEPKTQTALNQWKKVVSSAKAEGVSNRWTRLAQERLHDFDNAETYPVLRQDKIGTTEIP
jgi:cellulose synthase operon protein C